MTGTESRLRFSSFALLRTDSSDPRITALTNCSNSSFWTATRMRSSSPSGKTICFLFFLALDLSVSRMNKGEPFEGEFREEKNALTNGSLLDVDGQSFDL